MPKRASHANYYSGPAGNRDANLLRMLNARLATMSAARGALRAGERLRLPLGRFDTDPGQEIARAERRPWRGASRMPLARRVEHYMSGQRRLTGKQIKRLSQKAGLSADARLVLRQTAATTYLPEVVTRGL